MSTDDMYDLGGVQWELFGALFISWVLVYLCVCKGVRSSGKVSEKALRGQDRRYRRAFSLSIDGAQSMNT